MTDIVSGSPASPGGINMQSEANKILADKQKAANEQLQSMLGDIDPGVSLMDSMSQVFSAQQMQINETIVMNVMTTMNQMLKDIASKIQLH